jgi:hypothetical protein
MTRSALLPVLFATALALDCGGATHVPVDLDDAGNPATGGATGSNTGGAASGGAFGSGGSFGGGGESGSGGLTGTGGVLGDTGGSSGTADAGSEPADAGRDGGRRNRDGGFGGGFDGGRRRDGGGGMATQCPAGTRTGDDCTTMGMMCTSMGGGTLRTCVCRGDNAALTWRCQRQ